MNKVRTRFAPSPTGFLHIGGIRTAMYCYALARKYDGSFILRIEDTDRNRLFEGAEEQILEMLDKYGIVPDESIVHSGEYGPYRQSDRKEIYKEYAEKLIESGHAYYSFETKSELDEARELAEKNNQRFAFRSKYRDLPIEEARAKIAAGEKYVIRQRMPENEEVIFEDTLQGKMSFNTDEVDEGILLKSDGFPTYHLAVVVDDHLMEISHVFRGVEWIPSVPKHVLLYRAFGWEMPEIVHLSLILDPAGGKLSKRKGTVAADEFLKEGYLPEAVLNFLMLLGWSPEMERVHGESEREIFSLEDFVELFDLTGLNKSSPVFNREKLLWFNQQYINSKTADSIQNQFLGWFKEYSDNTELLKLMTEKGPDYLQAALELVRPRVKLLAEIPEMIEFFYIRPAKVEINQFKKLKNLKESDFKAVLTKYLETVKEDSNHEEWEEQVRKIAEELGIKAGEAFMSLRIATTGSEFSPPLYEVLGIIGLEEIKSRLKLYL